MKNLFTLIIALCLLSFNLLAQAPQAFKYQAVARDAGGAVLSDQVLGIKISILQGGPSGSVMYSETHNDTTNQFGLFSIEIGNGMLVSGDFNAIAWGDTSCYVQVEMDETGGSAYTLIGTSQLLSVPYALHAKTATDVNDADADSTNELQVISINCDTLFISQGNYIIIPGINPGSVQERLDAGETPLDVLNSSNPPCYPVTIDSLYGKTYSRWADLLSGYCRWNRLCCCSV